MFKGMQRFSCSCNDQMKSCFLQGKKEISQETEKKIEIRHESEEDEANLCIVCMNAKKDTVFYKCGHLECCYACALKMKDRDCPLCRVKILDVCKVFNM